MSRKGLSQVLALIVAAAVLMMTALTVIFMMQGGLSDLGETSADACISTIETQCSTTNRVINTPSVCTEGDQVIPGVNDPRIEYDEVNCQEW